MRSRSRDRLERLIGPSVPPHYEPLWRTGVAALAPEAQVEWARREGDRLAREFDRLSAGLRDLLVEVDCRIEHGVESGGHLEYVRATLRVLAEGGDYGRENG